MYLLLLLCIFFHATISRLVNVLRLALALDLRRESYPLLRKDLPPTDIAMKLFLAAHIVLLHRHSDPSAVFVNIYNGYPTLNSWKGSILRLVVSWSPPCRT